ncbi:DUF4180 domain-containing protein [Phyllobacteriaceae bacterium JZ32]
MSELVKIGNTQVLCFSEDGAILHRAADANDFLGDALSVEAELAAIPVSRLGPDFLKLSTGLAGEVFQKFVNYRLKCAIVGDISGRLENSKALRDFVRETNEGQSIWFVPDFDHLRSRLETTDR